MIAATPQTTYTSLLGLELAATLLGVMLSFAAPGWMAACTAKAERLARRLSSDKVWTVAGVGLAMLVLRLAMLPWFPAPQPFSTDDFSFLLAADTFAHGRLTNATPAMWTHLESIHLTMLPTYMSQYFPGPGLMMALGTVAFGHPWAGVLLFSALMCSAVCWMLQGWLPGGWPLLGSVILIVRVGLFSYWSNSYTGGAPLTILGGALVLGALPRLLRGARLADGMWMATGAAVLLLTRPYEGLLICAPAMLLLAYKLLYVPARKVARAVVLRRAVAPALLVLAAVAWLGFYNSRAFGKATIMPYTIARQTYAIVPYYIWQPERPSPHFRHPEMAKFYLTAETEGPLERHDRKGLFLFRKIDTGVMFFCGAVFLPLLFMLGRVARDRRIQTMNWFALVWLAGLGIGVYLIPHYLAPFTAGVYLLGLQAMRHLRVWRPEGKPVGHAMCGVLMFIMFATAGLRLFAEPLHMVPPPWPIGPWLCTWSGAGQYGAPRANVAGKFEAMPGKHLLIVRYSEEHEAGDEWVYNLADVEGAKTVWAREMDDASNAELFAHYTDRDVWLVEPDVNGGRVTPYKAGSLTATR